MTVVAASRAEGGLVFIVRSVAELHFAGQIFLTDKYQTELSTDEYLTGRAVLNDDYYENFWES